MRSWLRALAIACSETMLKAPGQSKLACLLSCVCAGGTSAGRFRGFKEGLRLLCGFLCLDSCAVPCTGNLKESRVV